MTGVKKVPITPVPDGDQKSVHQRSFEKMHPSLMESHFGQYVAVRAGEILAAGPNRRRVLGAAMAVADWNDFFIGRIGLPEERIEYIPGCREVGTRKLSAADIVIERLPDDSAS